MPSLDWKGVVSYTLTCGRYFVKMFIGASILILVFAWGLFVSSETPGAGFTYTDSIPLAILDKPSSITYDSTRKTLCIAEKGKGFIFEISKAGVPLGTIFTDAVNISDVAYTSVGGQEGFIIIQEKPEDILETDRHGCLLRSLKLPPEFQERTVKAVTLDSQGEKLYLALSGERDQILELAMDGRLTGSLSINDIQNIEALCYDPASKHLLLLSHGSTGKIYEVTLQGEILGDFTPEVTQAKGITRDEMGLLYVVCQETRRIYVYLPKKESAQAK